MEDYKTNHIEETIEQVGEPCKEMDIEYDDSFMDKDDKKNLINCILMEVKNSPNNAWCDEHMINCLALYRYKQVINKIDVEQYKREKEELNDPLTMLRSASRIPPPN